MEAAGRSLKLLPGLWALKSIKGRDTLLAGLHEQQQLVLLFCTVLSNGFVKLNRVVGVCKLDAITFAWCK